MRLAASALRPSSPLDRIEQLAAAAAAPSLLPLFAPHASISSWLQLQGGEDPEEVTSLYLHYCATFT